MNHIVQLSRIVHDIGMLYAVSSGLSRFYLEYNNEQLYDGNIGFH